MVATMSMKRITHFSLEETKSFIRMTNLHNDWMTSCANVKKNARTSFVIKWRFWRCYMHKNSCIKHNILPLHDSQSLIWSPMIKTYNKMIDRPQENSLWRGKNSQAHERKEYSEYPSDHRNIPLTKPFLMEHQQSNLWGVFFLWKILIAFLVMWWTAEKCCAAILMTKMKL
jgi:hypothetical protein